jgi:iron complex transport system substrate-binding protein
LESCPITNSNPYVTSIGTSSSSSKIVSLLPSGTEGLYALGLQDRLVGVSGFCDWPPEARTKPSAVTSLIDVDSMSSDEIEAAVQVRLCSSDLSPCSSGSKYKRGYPLAHLLQERVPSLILTTPALQHRACWAATPTSYC